MFFNNTRKNQYTDKQDSAPVVSVFNLTKFTFKERTLKKYIGTIKIQLFRTTNQYFCFQKLGQILPNFVPLSSYTRWQEVVQSSLRFASSNFHRRYPSSQKFIPSILGDRENAYSILSSPRWGIYPKERRLYPPSYTWPGVWIFLEGFDFVLRRNHRNSFQLQKLGKWISKNWTLGSAIRTTPNFQNNKIIESSKLITKV